MKPSSVTEYLSSLPEDRKKCINAIRKVIRKNLASGFKESFNWGMISYEVPLSTYANTYNGQPLMFAALGAQKNYFAIYLMCAYMDKEALKFIQDQYKKKGIKLNMGKSCIRFKSLDEIPLEAIGKIIRKFTLKKFVKVYELSRNNKQTG